MPAAEIENLPPRAASNWRRHGWSVIRVLIAAVLVGLAARQAAHMEEAALPWQTLDHGWLALCLGLTVVSVLGWWLRWLLFLRLTGVPASAGETFRLTWIADFFNYFLFGALAADGFRLALLARRHPGKLGAITASIAFDHMAGLLAVSFFFGVCTLPNTDWIIARGGAAAGAFLWPAGIALALVAASIIGGVGVTRNHADFMARKMARWPWFVNPMMAMLVRLRALRDHWVMSAGGLLASVLCLAASYAAFGAAARAWQVSLPLGGLFALLPVVDAYNSLPISVQGLGIREQFFLAVLAADGTATKPEVLAVSLTGFAVQAVWALLGGLLLALGDQRKRVSQDNPDAAAI